ncbi:hypothetical protein [Aquipseudomonas alcaligenes]|uniref:hypothetical protein n=1 Tax=Aquipseudomonas alcaligenes TaxID=43263 RepID=UPI003747CE13
MAALIVFFIFAFLSAGSAYLLSKKQTRNRFKKFWIGGLLIYFSTLTLTLWDAIPIWTTHQRLCMSESGLKIYKTPDQWAVENPDRYKSASLHANQIVNRRTSNTPSGRHSRVEFATGLELEIYNDQLRTYAHKTGIMRQRVSDKTTGEILFEVIDFHSGAGTKSLAAGASTWADYRFWTVTGRCVAAYPSLSKKFQYNGIEFPDLLSTIEGWGPRLGGKQVR